MFQKVNEIVNEITANILEIGIALRVRPFRALSKKCQGTKSPFIRTFGISMAVALVEEERIWRCFPDFYRKYKGRLCPTIWLTRDMFHTFSQDHATPADYVEAAVAYKP